MGKKLFHNWMHIASVGYFMPLDSLKKKFTKYYRKNGIKNKGILKISCKILVYCLLISYLCGAKY